MNIFILDEDPVAAAQAMTDRHVVKMCLETAQILCTVAHKLGLPAPYKPTHAQHPCTLWTGETADNARWLWLHGMALCDEYRYRYGKTHACAGIINEAGEAVMSTLPATGLTPYAVVIPPDVSKAGCAVQQYRTAYRKHKLPGSRYTKRKPPAWADGVSITCI